MTEEKKKRDPASYGNHSRDHMLRMNKARWAKFYEERAEKPKTAIETPVLNWVHQGDRDVK
jgi:hypothetical protein